MSFAEHILLPRWVERACDFPMEIELSGPLFIVKSALTSKRRQPITADNEMLATSRRMLMITRKLHDTEIMDNVHNVDARNLYSTADAMITVITLEPGQSLKRHVTPVDVAFYVLSGKGIVEIGGEKQEIAADTLVESPRDIVHCWYNESSEPLRFMIVKAPRPTRKKAHK